MPFKECPSGDIPRKVTKKFNSGRQLRMSTCGDTDEVVMTAFRKDHVNDVPKIQKEKIKDKIEESIMKKYVGGAR